MSAARKRQINRKLEQALGIARDLGYLKVPPDTVVEAKQLAQPKHVSSARLTTLASSH